MEPLIYYIDKKITKVEVVWTDNKNMYLKIIDNKVVCLAPKGIKEKHIKTFVDANVNSFHKYLEKAKANQLYSLSQDFLYLDGIKYKFNRLTGFNKIKFDVIGKQIDIYAKDNDDKTIEEIIKKQLKLRVAKYMENMQPKFEKKMSVPPHKIKVVYKTSTWGTNMVSKKSISYSSKLAHYNSDVLDYLIVHELAHNKQPNHSTDFWNLVEEHCPNYKNIRKQLRADTSMSE